MIYTSSSGSVYFTMCDTTTGEQFVGRLYLYSKVVLRFYGSEEVTVKKRTETGWITQKENRPILEFHPFDETAIEIGDIWIPLREVHGDK